MVWQPRGYVEILATDDPDDVAEAIWHENRACGRIRYQRSVVGPVDFLERRAVAGGDDVYVDNCQCAIGIKGAFAQESGRSIRTLSGGLPTLGKGHR